MPDLKIEYISIADVSPYSGNAKEHTEKQIRQIADSILENGFNDPVAIWGQNNIIVEGHGRVLAAQMLAMDEIPIIRLDHLTDEQRRAYTLIHNQLNQSTGYDLQRLEIELKGIKSIDMRKFDFSMPRIKAGIQPVETFSMDDIEPVMTADRIDSREYFSTAFTFPIDVKEAVMKYLRKHKAEITQEIIGKASNNDVL